MAAGTVVRAGLALGATLAYIAGAVPAVAPAANKGDRPNVVVIETDDQTQESIRVMANVDKLLARKGTTFTNSFVSFALCCPSRATFLTGQYSTNSGVQGNRLPLGGYPKLDSGNTLAVWLRNGGYYTALIGKYLNGYGNGNPPANAATAIPPGWTEWHGSVDPTTYRYYNYTLNEDGTLKTYGADPSPLGYQTNVYAAKAAELIRRRASSRQPFFLWTTFLAPHSGSGEDEPDDPNNLATPIPAPQDRNAFAGEPLPRNPSFNEADVSDKPAYVRRRGRLGPARRNAVREMYQQRLETVLGADRAVGAILDALKDSGEIKDTLIVFTSDNGFFHGEHRIPNGKVWPYEPSIRVPLVMRGPGVPRGESRDQLVANVDLAPTILDATGVKAGRLLDGRSLLPVLDAQEVEYGRDILLTNGPARPVGQRGPNAPRYSGLRSRNYVYLEYDTGERELYDLAQDPFQIANKASDPAYAGIRARLAARLDQLRACKGPGCIDAPDLSKRLTYSRGRLDGRRCARGNVRLSIIGTDSHLVSVIQAYVNGRLVKEGRPGSPVIVVPRSSFPRRKVATLRARTTTGDDRVVTLTAHVRACG
jgi:arylsulfatase A-like enzyme